MARSTEVPQTAGGFLWQPVRAVYWLAKAERDQAVGVEYLDDISLLEGGTHSPKLVEQDKFTAKPRSLVTDRSESLWKTIANWVSLDPQAISRIQRFVLATPIPLPPNGLAAKLCAASSQSEINKCYRLLMREARSVSPHIKKHQDRVTQAPSSIVLQVIEKLESDVQDPAVPTSAEEILKTLHLPDGTDLDRLYESLLGWVVRTLLAKWKQGQLGIITQLHFSNQISRIQSTMLDPARPRPFPDVTAEICQHKLNEQAGEPYVLQMKLIDLDDDDISDGKICFLAEAIERIRLVNEGNLTEIDIEQRDRRLHHRWKKKAKLIKAGDADSPVTQGKRIFYDTTGHPDHSGVFAGEPDLTEGAYHRLANFDLSNELVVGWHPDFRKLLP